MRGTTLAALTGASLSALIISQPVAAQSSDDASSSFGVEDIVVTAQKREQRLQDVPLAVTAVSQETLQANRVVNVIDLTGLAPGLTARYNAGGQASPQFSMRGIAASASQPSQDRQISIYLDGVYIGGSRGAVFDLPDTERIEVLRGPQGTLFGRNATAGAISVTSRDPKGEFGFRQDVTVGNYAQLRSRTTVDTPQIGPFSGYVTFVHDERRGDIRNLGAGTVFDRSSAKPFYNGKVTKSPRYLGNKNAESLFAALKFEATSDFTATYKFDWSDSIGSADGRGTMVINPTDFVGSTLNALIAAQPVGGGRYGQVVFQPDNKRPKAVNNAWSQPNTLKTQGHNLTLNWQASDSISVKNITSYRKSRVFSAANIAGLDGIEFTAGAIVPYATFAAFSSIPGLGSAPQEQQAAAIGAIAQQLAPLVGGYFAPYQSNNIGKGWQVSNELQVNYTSDFMDLVVGALYYESNEIASGVPNQAANFAFTPMARLPDGSIRVPPGGILDVRSHNYSYAAYAQADIHLTPQLDLQIGGRYTKDKKRGYFAKDGTQDNPTLIIDGPAATFKKSKPTYSIGLNYKPTEDILIYAKHSTAFLSGGSVGEFPFAPETVKAYEIGAKTDLFDRRVRFNFALWKSNYAHSQASQSGAAIGLPEYNVVVVDNGPLHSKGAEAELTLALVRGLTLSGSLAYTDVKYTDPDPKLYLAGATRYAPTSIPKWTSNVSAQYETMPLFDDATVMFRIDANYQGRFRAISDPDIEVNPIAKAFAPYEFSKARWIVNGRVALRDIPVADAKGEIGVWARNLFDNKDGMFPFPFGTILYTNSWQPARTFGLDLIVKY